MEKFLGRLSLRLRLTLLVGLLALVVVADQVIEIAHDRHVALEDSRARARDFAVSGAEEQANAIADTRAFLEVLADGTVNASPDCDARLTQLQETAPSFSAIFIAGADGYTYCSSLTSRTDITGRAYFRALMETGQPVVSDYNIGKVTKRPGIVVGVPKTVDGTVKVAFFARIDAFWLSRLAEGPASRSGAEILLLDRRGTVIAAAPHPEDWIGRDMGNEPDFQSIFAQNGAALAVSSFVGAERVVAHARLLKESGEVLVVSIPTQVVLAPYIQRARQSLAKLGLTVCVGVLLIWFGTERLIIRPLGAFAERARLIGEGDLRAYAVEPDVLPELRPLGRTLERMAAKLAARDKELREANALLAKLAATDPLTGLANRRHFEERAAEEWARILRERKPIAALVIDVDTFKLYNDTYGHAAGDECLRKVGRILEANARRPGDIVARTGGEEFIVLLPGAQISDACEIADRIRAAAVGMSIAHEASDAGRITLSIGAAATLPDREDGLDDLLEAADAALYDAKAQGRNRVVATGIRRVRLAG